ncbi:MAG: phospholipase effector Tle1 domain-containing protein [Bryobacteraceae bacterium]
MPKNIIICSDGTGNTGIKNRGTNVFKLFEALDLNRHGADPNLTPQIALYDDGVGTENFLPLKLWAGAFGWGLKRNVLKLYTGLVRIYDAGDRIYLFGFSRGAFTVRTLARLIAKCGILDWNRMGTTDAMRAEVAAACRHVSSRLPELGLAHASPEES